MLSIVGVVRVFRVSHIALRHNSGRSNHVGPSENRTRVGAVRMLALSGVLSLGLATAAKAGGSYGHPPAPIYNWTGVSVGLGVGVGFGDYEVEASGSRVEDLGVNVGPPINLGLIPIVGLEASQSTNQDGLGDAGTRARSR